MIGFERSLKIFASGRVWQDISLNWPAKNKSK